MKPFFVQIEQFYESVNARSSVARNRTLRQWQPPS
jgi:hypothetical protein